MNEQNNWKQEVSDLSFDATNKAISGFSAGGICAVSIPFYIQLMKTIHSPEFLSPKSNCAMVAFMENACGVQTPHVLQAAIITFFSTAALGLLAYKACNNIVKANRNKTAFEDILKKNKGPAQE